MKLTKIIWIVAIFAFVVGCQKKEQTAEKTMPEPEQEMVTVAEIPTFTYACLTHTGSFEDHESVINEFMTQINDQQITATGPMFGVYYNNPDEVPADELFWEIGIQVNDSTEVSAPLEIKQWTSTQVAQTLFTGPYDSVNTIYPQIFEKITAKNLVMAGPIMERFLDKNPQELKPNELKTQVWVPVTTAVADK